MVRHLQSLKFKLGLGGIAALVLGIGLTVWLLLVDVQQRTLSERQQAEIGEAARHATLLEGRLATYHRAMTAVARRLPPATEVNSEALQSILQADLVLRDILDSVFLATPGGKVLLLHDAKGYHRPDVNIADRAYFQQALKGHHTVSEPIVGRVTPDPMIILAQPVIVADEIVGVLGGSVRLPAHALLSGISDKVQGDAGQLVVVTDLNGRILSHPDPAMLVAPLSSEPMLAAAYRRLVVRGGGVPPKGIDLSLDDDLVSVASISNGQWWIWRHRSKSALLAPLDNGRSHALRWALALVGVLSVALVLTLWWLLRPLSELADRAQHMFDGQQPPDAGWPTVGGEIGALAAVLRQVGVERVQSDLANREVMRRLESVMAAAPIGILFTRAQRFELVSDQFCRMLGRERPQLIGELTQPVFASNEEYLQLGPRVGEAFAAGRAYDGEWAMLHADGHRVWVRLRGLPVDTADSGAGTVWTVQDITQEIAARQALEWAATHDPLCGLANRQAFDQRVAQVFDERPRSMPAALLLLDLDRFKPVNDTYGHAAGDAVLRAVAHAITAHVRSGDLVARLGGDEFAVLLERCPADVALRVAEQVRCSVADLKVPWQGHTLQIGTSVGVAALDEAFERADDWVAAGDRACYDAKASGRNTVKNAEARALRLVTG